MSDLTNEEYIAWVTHLLSMAEQVELDEDNTCLFAINVRHGDWLDRHIFRNIGGFTELFCYEITYLHEKNWWTYRNAPNGRLYFGGWKLFADVYTLALEWENAHVASGIS